MAGARDGGTQSGSGRPGGPAHGGVALTRVEGRRGAGQGQAYYVNLYHYPSTTLVACVC